MRRALVALLLLLAGCTTGDVPEPPAIPSCNDPCPLQISSSDAFEPTVAVDGDRILVAHTPFVDGIRMLELAAFNGSQWEVWRPDVLSRLSGCVHVFDPGVAFVDGQPIVTAIASGTDSLQRVLFSYRMNGSLDAIRPAHAACLPGFVPDFARISSDGVLVWRDLMGWGAYLPPQIAWSRWMTDGWGEPAIMVRSGDDECAGASGPTPVVSDGRLVVAYQDWSERYNQCVAVSGTDWSRADARLLATGALTWPTPLVVEDDVWVVSAVVEGASEVPTVWRHGAGWLGEAVPGMTSGSSTTVAAAANGPRVAVTGFRDGDYLALVWDDGWEAPMILGNGTAVGHAMSTTGMGHYMGLTAQGEGFRAVWVEGVEGTRRLMTSFIP